MGGPRPTIQDDEAEDCKERAAEREQDLEDDELAALEREIMGDSEDAELAKLQHRRKAQLRAQWKEKQQQMSCGAGRYEEMNERDLLKLASKGGNVVVHFYA